MLELKNIFQLFYVKDDQRSSQSSGVGLTLTKKMVEKLEGKSMSLPIQTT